VDQIGSWASRSGVLRQRKASPRGIILHTTGAGPWVRYKRDECALPYDAACRLYRGSMKYSPHFLVCGETGQVAAVNDLSLRALHVGSAGSWRYRLDDWAGRKELDWWFRRFPGLSSPRDLMDGALWRKGSANELTVGIEISPPCAGPRIPWTDACWDALRDLVGHLTMLMGIPRDSRHVITHSDAHPLKRITKSGRPWDPGSAQWNPIDAALQLGLA
jgi:hypothetical protein